MPLGKYHPRIPLTIPPEKLPPDKIRQENTMATVVTSNYSVDHKSALKSSGIGRLLDTAHSTCRISPRAVSFP